MAIHPTSDTIAAIATAPGVGGIGIIRISGPLAHAILLRLFKPFKPHASFQSHKLYYGTISCRDGNVLDEVLVVYMKAPATYTREDVVELHGHGSYLVLQSILAEVLAQGARAADPGEFTKRAFLAGRIDLTRAEAVIDLLQAQTLGGIQLAVGQMQGELFQQVEAVRKGLINILAVLEVAIDFPDDDVEILDSEHLLESLQEYVETPLRELISLADQGKVIREGVNVVIVGRPNVGKSSLLNALLREDRALVTPVPGTTRDTIEELISIKGIPVHLVDTAGIRAHNDLVEEMGIERARRKLKEADLVLFLVDADAGLTRYDRELYQTVGDKDSIVVCNKIDLAGEAQLMALEEEFPGMDMVRISAREYLGLDNLQDAIYRKILGRGELKEQASCAPGVRHRMVLEKSLAACSHLRKALVLGTPADLLAVEVQSALDYLGDIVGLTTPDDVLDTIFSEFCIGK